MRDVKNEILNFWFEDTKPQQWFQVNTEFDYLVKSKFAGTYDLAVQGIFDDWREDPESMLALILLMDQFPRNMFRGTSRSFATDSVALEFSKQAIDKHFDTLLDPVKRLFLYMPLQHSETMRDQEISVLMYEKIRKDEPISYKHALEHKEIISKFGRFPHRNAILGRENTPDEKEYLETANDYGVFTEN